LDEAVEPESQEITSADVGTVKDVLPGAAAHVSEPPPEPVVDLPRDLPLAPDGPEAELVRRIAAALPMEFQFMGASDDGWNKAAGGIVRRLSITSGDGPNDLRLI
jgi:hypothetical protein